MIKAANMEHAARGVVAGELMYRGATASFASASEEVWVVKMVLFGFNLLNGERCSLIECILFKDATTVLFTNYPKDMCLV